MKADKAKQSENSGSAEQRSSNEKSYAIAVIKELMANGTQDSCDEDKISEELDTVVKDVVDSIFELDDLLSLVSMNFYLEEISFIYYFMFTILLNFLDVWSGR